MKLLFLLVSILCIAAVLLVGWRGEFLSKQATGGAACAQKEFMETCIMAVMAKHDAAAVVPNTIGINGSSITKVEDWELTIDNVIVPMSEHIPIEDIPGKWSWDEDGHIIYGEYTYMDITCVYNGTDWSYA